MSLFRRLRIALICLLSVITVSHAAADPAQRIVSVGGSVTEIIYELGQEHRLVARDTTSSWPEEAEALPDVGYVRALSAEGVLSMAPDLILAKEGAGPPEALELLQAASIPLVIVPDAHNAEGVLAKIDVVAAALGVEEEGEKLRARVADELDQAQGNTAREGARKRVLFILSAQGGGIRASGTGTSADSIIRMSGGENAVSAFEGYKPMTDEAIIAAQPDVILMMDHASGHAASNEALFALPALALTPAAKTNSVVRMDGLLLTGFGPRTAEAVTKLNAALYDDPS